MAGESLSLRVDDLGDRMVAGAADRLGERVGLVGLLADLDRSGRQARTVPIPRRADAAGFCWDAEDGATPTWWPQGITTSADAAARGSPAGLGDRSVLLSAWYARPGRRPDTATRVSVVDLDAGAPGPRYAHVLLVEPYRRPWSVRPRPRRRLVRVHAGGLAWCGNRLLVADTRRGVRVFDLADLVRLGPGAPESAHGVDHVLPQRAAWRAGSTGGTRPLRWSFLALDRTEPGRLSLVAGEYDRPGPGTRLARWALDPGTCLPLRTAPEEVLRTDIPSMQGAVRVEGRYVISASRGSRRRGDLWTGPAGGPYERNAAALPVGPEDLSYDPTTGRLWTQTEHPGSRYVLRLPTPA